MLCVHSRDPIKITHSPEVTNASADGCTVTKIALYALRALCLSLLAAGVGCIQAGLVVPAIALFVAAIGVLVLVLDKSEQEKTVEYRSSKKTQDAPGKEETSGIVSPSQSIQAPGSDFISRRPPVEELDFPLKENVGLDGDEWLGKIGTEKLHVGGAVISIGAGDLFKAGVPCIVNAANEQCLGGGGIDGAIHKAAGPGLRELCRELPIVQGSSVRCKTGDAVITGSASLVEKDIQFIIHAVGPIGSDPNKEALLQAVYQNILVKAQENGIRSLAIPAISTGVFGFPFGIATEIAIRTVEKYLHEHPEKFDEVKLVFLDREIESAKNCAWAIHIARHMDHPVPVTQFR